jgi:hypothetical protein
MKTCNLYGRGYKSNVQSSSDLFVDLLFVVTYYLKYANSDCVKSLGNAFSRIRVRVRFYVNMCSKSYNA